MTQFVIVEAHTLAQAEIMRVIRNSCREFMTNDPAEISPEDQREWFIGLDRKTTRPYVGLVVSGDPRKPAPIPIAYGLVRNRDGTWWVSGGLLPEHRGQGWGRQLFTRLVGVVDTMRRSTWLEVRRDNDRAERLYRSLGFVPVYTNESIITMRKAYVP